MRCSFPTPRVDKYFSPYLIHDENEEEDENEDEAEKCLFTVHLGNVKRRDDKENINKDEVEENEMSMKTISLCCAMANISLIVHTTDEITKKKKKKQQDSIV